MACWYEYSPALLLPTQSRCRADSRDAWQHQSASVPFLWRGRHDDTSPTQETEEQESCSLHQMRLPGHPLQDHVVR